MAWYIFQNISYWKVCDINYSTCPLRISNVLHKCYPIRSQHNLTQRSLCWQPSTLLYQYLHTLIHEWIVTNFPQGEKVPNHSLATNVKQWIVQEFLVYIQDIYYVVLFSVHGLRLMKVRRHSYTHHLLCFFHPILPLDPRKSNNWED